MARSKIHHYVPKTLQNRFRDKNDQIWYAERQMIEVPFRQFGNRNPHSCFKFRNFYTVLDEEDNKSDRIEREFYGKLDNYIGSLLQEIEDALKVGRVPLFGGCAQVSLNNLIVAIHKRTPDVASPLQDRAVGQKIIDGAMDDARKSGLMSHSHLQEIAMPDAIDLGRDVRVRAQTAKADDVLSALQDYETVTVQTNKGCSFVLGSRMIYRISNYTSDKLGSKNIEFWMPVSPSTCLVTVHKANRFPKRIVIDRDHVRQVNEFICRYCVAVASHSSRLMASLLRLRPTINQ